MFPEERTCKNCGNTLILSSDYEQPMYEHTETGSIYCWDESDTVGEPEIEPMLQCNTSSTKLNV